MLVSSLEPKDMIFSSGNFIIFDLSGDAGLSGGLNDKLDLLCYANYYAILCKFPLECKVGVLCPLFNSSSLVVKPVSALILESLKGDLSWGPKA